MTYLTQQASPVVTLKSGNDISHSASHVYVDEGEAQRMTYQVGLVTTEGVLLASDRQYSDPFLMANRPRSPKIHVHERENLAYCSAGDMLCEEFVKRIRKHNKEQMLADREIEDVRDVLALCAEEAKSEAARFREAHPYMPQLFGGNTFIVYRSAESIRLWTIKTQDQTPNPSIIDIDSDPIAAGANSPAAFFTNRYFERLPKKMAILLPLVAHTVLMAESESVKGIQIGIFTRDKFRIMDAKELKPLIRLSRKLSKEMDSLVLSALRKMGELKWSN
jgi:20S proteasome alpha/beta subunit